MSDVKWIKIVTDIFDDEKMLLIESLPAADSIITIWFKLLCMAGKQNNHGVFIMNERIAYTDQMLATIFRRELPTVQLALRTFQEFGMVEIIDGVITIPNWEKHQSLDKYEKHKEEMRLRMRQKREEQKLLALQQADDKQEINVSKKFINVSPKNKIKNKDKEIDEDKDIESKPARHKHGEYKNVLLSDEDMRKLQGEFPNDWQEWIEKLSEYMAQTGKSYKNHLATIRNWARKDRAYVVKDRSERKGSYFQPTAKSMSYAEYQAIASSVDEEDDEEDENLPF